MNRSIYFCRSWSLGYYEPRDALTEAEARAHEAAGTWYTILVDDPVRPSSFIHTGLRDDGKRGYTVCFLDGHLRVYVEYTFRQYDRTTLFMEVGTENKYHDDDENPYWGAAHHFSEDRTMFTDEGDYPPFGQERTIDRYTNTFNDERFDQLFEPIPTFGEYDSLIRLDRGTLHLQQ
jgi:hypothetical protein